MKIDLNDLGHNPAVQRILRNMKCLEIHHGDGVLSGSCVVGIDDRGKVTLTFEKPKTKFKALAKDDMHDFA